MHFVCVCVYVDRYSYIIYMCIYIYALIGTYTHICYVCIRNISVSAVNCSLTRNQPGQNKPEKEQKVVG